MDKIHYGAHIFVYNKAHKPEVYLIKPKCINLNWTWNKCHVQWMKYVVPQYIPYIPYRYDGLQPTTSIIFKKHGCVSHCEHAGWWWQDMKTHVGKAVIGKADWFMEVIQEV